MHCEYCGSEDLEKRGMSDTKRQRYVCKNCGKWGLEKEEEDTEQYTFTDNGDTAEVFMTVDQDALNSPEKLLKAMNVDGSVWEVYKKQIGKSTAWRKERSVDWEVVDGKTTNGKVKDTGKIKIVPVFTVKLWLRRKTLEIRASLVVDEIIERMKKFSPKYPKIKYTTRKEGLLYEIAMPDLQIGRLVMESEAGKEVSPDTTIAKASSAIRDLLERTKGMSISKILFPIGNDFFDSNTAAMMTAHGTPQQDDVRWQRTFGMAQDFIVKAIDTMTAIAPVDVLVVHGNHDEERIHYFGKVIEAWYHSNRNVNVDTSPNKRKYYLWNKNLVMFTHGYYEKNDRLQGLMAFEKPEWWAASVNREIHLGDKHHKVDIIYKTEELENGVVVRILRSLADPSVWEHDKGLVGSLKAAEGFVWHPTRGVIDQKTSIP